MGSGRCDVEDENRVERRGLWRFLGDFFSSYWGCEGRAKSAFCCCWTVESGVNSSRGVCARVEAAVPGRPSVEVDPEAPGKSVAGGGRGGLDCDLIRVGYEFNILLYDRHRHAVKEGRGSKRADHSQGCQSRVRGRAHPGRRFRSDLAAFYDGIIPAGHVILSSTKLIIFICQVHLWI